MQVRQIDEQLNARVHALSIKIAWTNWNYRILIALDLWIA